MDHRELEQIQAGISRNDDKKDPKAQQEQEMKNSILSQILTSEARERLMRINMVKPERAQQAENVLVQLARSGQLRYKIDEPQLVDLLGRMNQEKEQKVTFRRKYDSDSDEEDIEPSRNVNAGAKSDDDDFFD